MQKSRHAKNIAHKTAKKIAPEVSGETIVADVNLKRCEKP